MKVLLVKILEEEKIVKKDGKRILALIPPTDPRVLMQIAPFLDETLAQFDFKDRKDLCTAMMILWLNMVA